MNPKIMNTSILRQESTTFFVVEIFIKEKTEWRSLWNDIVALRSMPLLLYSWTYNIIFGQGNLDVMQKPEYPAIYRQSFCKFQDFCVRSRLLFHDKLNK